MRTALAALALILMLSLLALPAQDAMARIVYMRVDSGLLGSFCFSGSGWIVWAEGPDGVTNVALLCDSGESYG